MRKHLLAIAVILTVPTGCDNVAWGGIDVELKPPPEPARVAETDGEAEAESGPINANGPLLLAGVRTGLTGDFVLVGEVLPEGVRPFPDPEFPEDADRLASAAAVGSEWVLFSEGVRVGRMVVDATAPADDFCGSRTTLSGVVEMVSPAATAERLLALPAADASSHAYGEYLAIGDAYAQRVATITMAGEAIPRYGATWPTEGVLDAREDIRVFQLSDANSLSVAATFLFQDALTVSSPRQGAYSLFVMGRQSGDTYGEEFSWYRSVEAEGKGAPRYFDHLDWDGDGEDEILLEVMGSNRRWFAVLSRVDGTWTRTFQDACGSGSATGG